LKKEILITRTQNRGGRELFYCLKLDSWLRLYVDVFDVVDVLLTVSDVISHLSVTQAAIVGDFVFEDASELDFVELVAEPLSTDVSLNFWNTHVEVSSGANRGSTSVHTVGRPDRTRVIILCESPGSLLSLTSRCFDFDASVEVAIRVFDDAVAECSQVPTIPVGLIIDSKTHRSNSPASSWSPLWNCSPQSSQMVLFESAASRRLPQRGQPLVVSSAMVVFGRTIDTHARQAYRDSGKSLSDPLRLLVYTSSREIGFSALKRPNFAFYIY